MAIEEQATTSQGLLRVGAVLVGTAAAAAAVCFKVSKLADRTCLLLTRSNPTVAGQHSPLNDSDWRRTTGCIL